MENPKKDVMEMIYEPEYFSTVKNIILLKMKSRGGICEHDLQDCISEVYEVALEKRQEIEEHPCIQGWLTDTAKNIVKRYIRKRAIESRWFSDNGEAISEVIDDDDEYQRLLLEYLGALKANLRRSEYTLFTMRFIDKMSVEEIAEKFGKNKHAIDARIYRLKKKSKKIFTKREFEPFLVIV